MLYFFIFIIIIIGVYLYFTYPKYNIELVNGDLMYINTIWLNSSTRAELKAIKPSWWIMSPLPVIPASSILPSAKKYIQDCYPKIF
jgi:hypothetical protein